MKAPSATLGRLVEWRAKRISDPVQRLRYLRRSAASRAVSPWNRIYTSKSLFRLGLLATVIFLIPFSTISDFRPLSARTIPKLLPVNASDVHSSEKIWLVETRDGQEIYSNSLRVETRFQVPSGQEPTETWYRLVKGSKESVEMEKPVGIVFHTTESHMASFEEGNNRRLKFLGESLLRHIREKRAYHYVIDRFGRVWRITPEDEPAFHAGSSIWQEPQWDYINLNHSFLGVAFEAQTRVEDEPIVTDAQKLSAKLLTAMLRTKYHIPAYNCVTHAQVSVSNENYGIGYHTDWAGDFPFSEVGLPDNYQLPLPSVYEFGFLYDSSFVNATGERLWKGLSKAEELLRQQATAQGVPVAQLSKRLRENYRQIIENLKKEKNSEVKN